MLPDKLKSRIACPNCQGALAQSEVTQIDCVDCGCRYPVVADAQIPILFADASVFAKDGLDRFAGYALPAESNKPEKKYREARMLPRTNVTNISGLHKAKFLESIERDGVVLNVGSGKRRLSIQAEVVNLDIAPSRNCDVVGDAHYLPFRDESFNAVMSDSVFEHLSDPFRAAREIARVLKPGGIMWCSAPLAYPIHGSPGDFFRYTPEGLKSVFRELDVSACGPSLGPFATIGLFSERVADSLFPWRFGFVARWVIAWMLHPLKYLDPWLVGRNPDCASGVFIFAKKAETQTASLSEQEAHV